MSYLDVYSLWKLVIKCPFEALQLLVMLSHFRDNMMTTEEGVAKNAFWAGNKSMY